MEVEIELKSAALAGDIHELRKYLEENMDGLRLEIKTQPAPEGQMVIEEIGIGLLHGILEGIGREGGKKVVEGGKKMIQLIKDWNKKNTIPADKGSGIQALGPGVSIADGKEKYYITEDANGNTQVYDNFNFAIDVKNTYALLIGVSEFEGDFPPIPPIRNNLVDFYDLLVDKRNVGLPRKNVQVVFNKTDHEMAEMMLGISRIPGMETLIIYYSGHGYKSDVKSLTLTARNTKKIGDVIIGGIDLGFVTDKVLRPSTASQKILILDACHSGIAAQGDDDVVRLIDVKGTYTLTSSGDEASYFNKHAKNTFFTGVMLDLFRKGIDDVSKEMLSLEDIYRSSSQKLAAEKFPRPNSKNELNIPAADFLLARNPSFSVEKLKQKADLLRKQGRLNEADHEYIILLRRFPDDEQLRKQAEECRAQLRFTELAAEGDEAYFSLKNFRKALEKYKEALQIRDDVTIATKISKCEERLRTGRENDVTRTEEPVKPPHQPIKKEEEKKLIQEPPDLPRQGVVSPPPQVNPFTFPSVVPASTDLSGNKTTWSLIALGWLVLSAIMLAYKLSYLGPFDFTDYFEIIFTRALLPFVLIAALLIALRNRAISHTEILIYIIGFLPASYISGVTLIASQKDFGTSTFLFIVQAAAYFFYFRKAVPKFSILDFVIAGLPLLYFSVITFVTLFLALFAKNDAAGFSGIFAGIAITVVTMILFYRIRKKANRK